LVLLLRKLPRAKLIRSMCASAGIKLLEFGEVQERTPTLEILGCVHRARLGIPDLVLVVRGADGRTLMIWIVEAQLCWDHKKQWDWALFPAAFGAETRTQAKLAAFVPDPALRGRIRRTMIPKIQPRPILMELDQIELIVDTAEACRRPQEAVFGATFHAREKEAVEQRVAGIRAAFIAMQSLDSLERRSYTVLMLTIAPPAIAQRALAEAREHGELDRDRYAEISEIERTGYLFHVGHEAGRQEGHEEGRQEGQRSGQIQVLRRALVDVLELRGFVVPLETRTRIDACDELRILERWYAKARTLPSAASVEQLFD
jgi:hypothetical protein